MALIECPECGKKVSSMAEKCPDCGYPIAKDRTDGEVAVVINADLAGKVRIYNIDNSNSVLWEGKCREIARFNVDKDTQIGFNWGLGCGDKPAKIGVFTVKAGKKYEFKMTQVFFAIKWVLNEIDTFDSGL